MSAELSPSEVQLVAIINSFNRRSLLERAIGSLFPALRDLEIPSAAIVFEAGSNDGSREFLQRWQEEHGADRLVIISPRDSRSSFSDGVNAACIAAAEKFPSHRWLFLYETDNALRNAGPLRQAIALLSQEPKLAATGFTVTSEAGARIGYGMRFPSALSLALGQNIAGMLHLHSPNKTAWRKTGSVRWRTSDIVFTSPLLIRREAWKQSGGLDPAHFPFSDSDLDWAWRCTRLGWEMAVIDCDGVVHDNLEQISAWSAGRVVDFHRSRLRLLRRYRGDGVSLFKPVLFARHLLEIAILKRSADPRAAGKLERRRQLLRTVWKDYA
jgi:GT2 family glycosyltransferase